MDAPRAKNHSGVVNVGYVSLQETFHPEYGTACLASAIREQRPVDIEPAPDPVREVRERPRGGACDQMNSHVEPIEFGRDRSERNRRREFS